MITLSSTDARAPYVLDIHELARRPGAQRRVRLHEVSPGGLELDGVVGVPDTAELDLDLRLESVVEGVLVSGTVKAPYAGVCARCLDPVVGELVVDLQELYVYPDTADSVNAGGDAEVDDDELPVVDDTVDLEQPVRDAVVLALPSAPLCRDDCPGLCSQCGARLADDPTHRHDTTDPRWAALSGLLADAPQESTTGTPESGSNGAGPTEET